MMHKSHSNEGKRSRTPQARAAKASRLQKKWHDSTALDHLTDGEPPFAFMPSDVTLEHEVETHFKLRDGSELLFAV